MMKNPLNQWFCGVCILFILLKVDSVYVDIVILDSAVAKGAVCLDGSAPAYQFDKGSGAGANNWLVFLEGGGWCSTVAECKAQASKHLGSSKYMEKSDVPFFGILNNGSLFSPDFYNWNRIVVRYCDGASFTGDVETVNPADNLHFRGARIFKTIVNELLDKGMKDADRVVLSGCSAGGLSVNLNCDRFKAMLPSNSTTVKCVADAGYFINIKDVTDHGRVEAYYDKVVSLHGSAKYLPESCTSTMKSSLCFFPQYVVHHIQTPIFFVNAAYDVWQIGVNYAPDSLGPQGFWTACKNDLANCSVDQMKTIQHFYEEFLNAFKEAATSPSTKGYFINGCYAHCQTDSDETWFRADSPKLSGKTVSSAVGDWVYDLRSFEMYGPSYPYDKTCHNYVKQN